MTKEKALELSNILKAYSEGKIIQILCYGKNGANDAYWKDFDFKINPELYLPDSEFPFITRIKPESKLVPFTFEDNGLFKDKWIIFKEDKFMCKIIGFDEKRVYLRSNNYTYYEFLRFFTFEDDSPCGKYVEE